MRVQANDVLKDHDPTKSFNGDDLPIGEYLCKLVKAEDVVSQDGKWNWLSLWFDVIEGDYQGRKSFVKFFEPTDDEKAKQFASNIYQSFGLDLREYPEGIDVTAYVQQFVYDGTNPTAPTYVVKVKAGKKNNPNTGLPYVNQYVSEWDGRPVKSPKRGVVSPSIPGVPTGAAPIPGVPAKIDAQTLVGEKPAPVPNVAPKAAPIARPKNPLFDSE